LESNTGNSSKIARSAGVVSIAVMCSRLLGLIREQVFAGMFGAGFAYDAFVVAFRIPNLLRDLFAEGALSAAFVTVFSQYDSERSAEETWQLASNVLTFFTLAISIIILVGMLFAAPLVNFYVPDFHLIAGKSELTVKLTRILLPFLLFISLAAVVMGILNTKGHFFVPAMASTFFNLGSIVGGVALAYILPHYGHPAIVGMAFGTLVGGFLQLVMQFPALRKTGFRYRPCLQYKDPGLLKILRLMIPATIGLSATQINIFINTNFAASCQQGSVSWLNYAFRLVQLPIGIFGVALAIAMMPILARHAAHKDIGAMRETMVSSLVMVSALTLPATAGLMLLSEPIIRLIFEHGRFTNADTLATAQTLSLYAVGLFAYSANKIMVPAFYALDKTKYPVIASFLAIGTNIIIIQLTIDRFQHLAIALSTSFTMLLNFLFLFLVLYVKMGHLPLRYLARGLMKITLAVAVMSGVVLCSRNLLAGWLGGSLSRQGIAVFLCISAAAFSYTVLLYMLRLTELQETVQAVRRKFSK
jgi:putative peptidoglycan lipid II flippase